MKVLKNLIPAMAIVFLSSAFVEANAQQSPSPALPSGLILGQPFDGGRFGTGSTAATLDLCPQPLADGGVSSDIVVVLRCYDASGNDRRQVYFSPEGCCRFSER